MTEKIFLNHIVLSFFFPTFFVLSASFTDATVDEDGNRSVSILLIADKSR